MNTKNDILNAEKDEIIFSAIEGIEFNGESFDFESLEEELENKLISEFEDLDMLKEELKAVEDPDKLGKVILDEVWKQFGNQIGLDMTNETLIQKYDREHPESYADIKNSIMQDPAYKEAKRVAEEAQMNGTLIDEYTGKSLNPGENVNVDHVIPRKEIFDDPRRKQANIDTATLANKEENLAVTNEALNKSKGAKTNTEYVNNREQREKELIAQNERANKKIEESNLSDVEKKCKLRRIIRG